MIQVIARIYALLHLLDKNQHTPEHLKIVKPELSMLSLSTAVQVPAFSPGHSRKRRMGTVTAVSWATPAVKGSTFCYPNIWTIELLVPQSGHKRILLAILLQINP